MYVDQRQVTPETCQPAEKAGFSRAAFGLRSFQLDRKTAQSWIALVALSLFVAVVAACSAPTEDAGSSESALAQAGRWAIPASVKDVGKTVRFTYDEAPRWTGTSACSGKLKVGGKKLGDYLIGKFGVITSVGGYACRRNTADTARMSVHGTGRALDVFIPRTGGKADNGQGDKVANWLVLNAQRIGVQLIIWDRTIWRANGTNDGAYGGPHPHDDHLHVELTNEAGAATTPWFTDPDDADASTDGSVADASDASRDDGSTTTVDAAADAGVDSATTTIDAGGTGIDAGAPDAAATEPDEDAGKPAGETKGEEPPPANGDPSSGIESAEDDPGETDSLGDDETSSKRNVPSVADDESMPNGGCSMTSRNDASPAGALFGVMALVVTAAARSRRNRD